jgi:hypothetical protein
MKNGIRIFDFRMENLELMVNLIKTAELFAP